VNRVGASRSRLAGATMISQSETSTSATLMRNGSVNALMVVGLLIASGARAQSPTDTTSIFGTATGGFIALSVPDIATSAKWYEEKLGMHRVMTVGRMDHIVGVVALEANGVIVEIIQRDDARVAAGAPELTHGISKAGIIVADFDRVVRAL